MFDFDVRGVGEGEETEQDLLGRGEQLVTPVHRRPEGLLPTQCRPATPGQQVKTIVQPGSNLLDG